MIKRRLVKKLVIYSYDGNKFRVYLTDILESVSRFFNIWKLEIL